MKLYSSNVTWLDIIQAIVGCILWVALVWAIYLILLLGCHYISIAAAIAIFLTKVFVGASILVILVPIHAYLYKTLHIDKVKLRKSASKVKCKWNGRK